MTAPRRAANNNNRSDNRYTPAPYSGDGFEVIANLSASTNSPAVLAAVASWHRKDWRRHNGRHQTIAAALDNVARAAA